MSHQFEIWLARSLIQRETEGEYHWHCRSSFRKQSVVSTWNGKSCHLMPTSRSGTFMCSTSTATGATWTELRCRNSGKALISEWFSGFQLGGRGGGGGPCRSHAHTCMHAHRHACAHASIHTGMHVHLHPRTHTHTCTHPLTHTHTHMRAHTHTYRQTHTCTHTTHTHKHVHTHAHTHTYAHTHTPPLVLLNGCSFFLFFI